MRFRRSLTFYCVTIGALLPCLSFALLHCHLGITRYIDEGTARKGSCLPQQSRVVLPSTLDEHGRNLLISFHVLMDGLTVIIPHYYHQPLSLSLLAFVSSFLFHYYSHVHNEGNLEESGQQSVRTERSIFLGARLSSIFTEVHRKAYPKLAQRSS